MTVKTGKYNTATVSLPRDIEKLVKSVMQIKKQKQEKDRKERSEGVPLYIPAPQPVRPAHTPEVDRDAPPVTEFDIFEDAGWSDSIEI